MIATPKATKTLEVGDVTSFGTVTVAPEVSPSGKTCTITVDNGRRTFTDRISAVGNTMVFTDA